MNLLDSSGWLEYFADGAGADNFVQALKDIDRLIVPSVCLYEVFKIVLRERNENDALQRIPFEVFAKTGNPQKLTYQAIVIGNMFQSVKVAVQCQANHGKDQYLPQAHAIIS